MPAYLAGLVLLVGRAWDGVMDPVMGMIVDSTTSQRGKHRFWMLVAIGPFVLFFFLLWIRLPGSQLTQFILYSLLFLLFSTSFTMYNIPTQHDRRPYRITTNAPASPACAWCSPCSP